MGFEFVNGFHDTANAVATVIYTHSLEPHIAVVWSGLWNFLGVVTSSGLVAFGIISLLPVELILQVGSKAGFAMVFALLVAAIIWNLSTWYFGLPASSSHTLIGSIIGVGIANQLMSVRTGTSGVDWGQALNIGKSLLLSPLVGFAAAFLLLSLMKAVVKNKKLYEAPEGTQPPPFWIRALLLLTCTGVSFAHGSNDGQKGMGLIMLILIGTDLPFGFNYSFEAMNYAKNAGNLLLVRPRVIGSKSSGLLETKEPRNFSIEFEGPAQDTDTFEIALPPGYEVDDLPPPVDVDYSFASYHSKTAVAGNAIRYSRTFEIKELSVPASKADDLKKFYRIVASDERNTAVLKPVSK